ncbi:MAG: sulfoxide reductase heme-binding subunit YedZ [Gemmatimonadetes bacterium]|nr:sulfoxide reductase heme-binding subunit YedZ [Gemmatimonadota bacterium]
MFALALVPLALILRDGLTGRLGAEPIRAIQLRTGWWALTFLLITLSVTPLRRLSGWNPFVKFRRMLGLFAFFYAVLHLSNYVGVDQFFAWKEIGEDILKRPWITIGFSALVLITPLALTSTQAMVRRLGKRWAALHRLVYVAAACGVLHFLWLVKKDTTEPATFGLVLILLLALRLRLQARKPKPSAVSQQPSVGNAVTGAQHAEPAPLMADG